MYAPSRCDQVFTPHNKPVKICWRSPIPSRHKCALKLGSGTRKQTREHSSWYIVLHRPSTEFGVENGKQSHDGKQDFGDHSRDSFCGGGHFLHHKFRFGSTAILDTLNSSLSFSVGGTTYELDDDETGAGCAIFLGHGQQPFLWQSSVKHSKSDTS
eukprot:7316117-Karenia_brevis.AAC.1